MNKSCIIYRKAVNYSVFLFTRCIICIFSAIYAEMLSMDRDAILKKIKMKRVSLGLSQDRVAQALRIDDGQYSRLENGKSELDLSRLLQLLTFLGMTWADLDDSNMLPAGDLDTPEGIKRELAALRAVISQIEKKVN